MTGHCLKSLVVGVGNPTRGDDAAGPTLAARVAAIAPPAVRVVETAEPLRLLDYFADHDHVVVVDAIRSGRAPGSLHVRVVDDQPLPARGGVDGTHGLGVADAVEIARALGRLPRRLVLVGIEAQSFELGTGLSPAVQQALDGAVHAVLQSIPAAES